ncbi:hypothetical protein C472_07485, partial [Halorubrum tebenquichense DSM 14210]
MDEGDRSTDADGSAGRDERTEDGAEKEFDGPSGGAPDESEREALGESKGGAPDGSDGGTADDESGSGPAAGDDSDTDPGVSG